MRSADAGCEADNGIVMRPMNATRLRPTPFDYSCHRKDLLKLT
jgi:hypothetical protein